MDGKIKKKRGKKIFLIILAVILVLIAVLGIWQRNNIKAVYKVVTQSGDEIANELDNTKKSLEEKLKEQAPTVVSDFTAEEESKIMKGDLTHEDAVKALNEKKANQKDAVKNEVSKDNGAKKPLSEKDKKVDELIGDKVIELYSLKAYYLGQLGQLEATVLEDYFSLPDAKRNMVGRKEIASKYIGKAMGLLSNCDSKVAALLSELKTELNALKADTSIIKTIESAYENEKALKKAYYIKLLGE